MFKLITTFVAAILISAYSFAQIPDGYYSTINSQTGDALKAALHDIIKDHVEYPYTSSNTDTWDILKEADQDSTNSENVTLLYSGWSLNAEEEYNSGSGWSREHTWAKSHGDFGTTMGAGTDCHHIRACDISVNSARNNKDFDNGGSIYVDGDGTTECKTDEDSWEPRDAVKGDVARMLFYMAVRYEGEDGEPDLELVDEVNTVDLNEDGKGYHGKLSTLLEWHTADPVDSFEIRRNNVIYSYQNNRNPFIDHPEYVEQIWSTITSVSSIESSAFKIYPNPATDYIIVETDGPAYGMIYTINGEKVREFNIQSKETIRGLNSGMYLLQIVTGSEVFNSKVIVR